MSGLFSGPLVEVAYMPVAVSETRSVTLGTGAYIAVPPTVWHIPCVVAIT